MAEAAPVGPGSFHTLRRSDTCRRSPSVVRASTMQGPERVRNPCADAQDVPHSTAGVRRKASPSGYPRREAVARPMHGTCTEAR